MLRMIKRNGSVFSPGFHLTVTAVEKSRQLRLNRNQDETKTDNHNVT